MPLSNTKPLTRLSVRRSTSRLLVAAVAVASVLAMGAANAESASAATGELVVNGDFSAGVQHWRTNAPEEHELTATTQARTGTQAAQIHIKTRRAVVLNEQKDTVSSTIKGNTYTMTAWVRSSRAGTVAQIKARELGTGEHYSHEYRYALPDTAWHQLKMDFTARWGGSTLDLNIQFWGNVVGQDVYVDSVSLIGQDSTLPSQDEVTLPGQQESVLPGQCAKPAPTGTMFGSSLSTSGQTAAQSLAGVDAIFGKVPVARVFDPGMVMPWSKPRTQMLAGRDLVISFRPMPQDVLSGKYDAEFRSWFKQAPADVTIYWSYIHEPEPMIIQGKFTADQYRRAWQRIEGIADEACRTNMYSTLILTGWTTQPASKRDWRTYYAGDDVIDVMAFDPYNGASNPTAVRSYPSAASMFDSVRKVAAEAGKPYGIAETGSPKIPGDVTGSARAAWLNDVAAYSRQHGALFVTYFHSSRDGEWRLLDGPSQTAWRAAVASSR